jgi:two-component system chemotaxis response regulator CheY
MQYRVLDDPGERKRPEGIDEEGKPYRILIVDDSTTMRKIISQFLKSEAYDVCGEASNGAEAVKMYKQLSPDVVTLDINMPELSGLEALALILSEDSDARVIMLTSEGQKETVMQALAIGAKGFIVKPPQRADVCLKIKAAVES